MGSREGGSSKSDCGISRWARVFWPPMGSSHRDTENGGRLLERTMNCAFSVPPCLCGNRPFWRQEAYRSACDFRRRNIFLLFQTFRLRFVDAEWLLIEIVAGSRISTRAATHANVAELAAAALALQVVGIAQLIEHHRTLPDVGERLLFQIPCQGRQVS